jgi:segregation and condensation protein B
VKETTMHEGDEDEVETNGQGGGLGETAEVVDAPTSERAAETAEGQGASAGEDDDVEPLSESTPTETDERLIAILESVLFACAEPITLARLAEVVAGPTRGELRAALAALTAQAEHDRRGIRLIEVAGGYQFRTAPEHAEWVRRLFQQRPWRLTRATLETLAIVAYKQPRTRAEIEAIRGVDVDSVLASLLARKLVKIVGRKDVIGRPLLYGTTRQFLEVFGLRDLTALPGLSEVASAMPESVGAGAAGNDEETWSGDERNDEGHPPAEAAGGLGDLLAPSGGDHDRERSSDRKRQDGQDPGEQGSSD